MPTKTRSVPSLNQRPIHTFGKISKSQPPKPEKNARKRKLEEEEGSTATQVATPGIPRKKARTKPSDQATPTRGARSLLQSFSIVSAPARQLFAEPVKQLETPPSSQDQDIQDALPEELQNLLDLHSSFLTALSLQFANRSVSPVDLRILCPSITQTWRKRRVRHEDIQRILGVQQAWDSDSRNRASGAFALSDFGQGKVCIEIISRDSDRRPINEEKLNLNFRQSLLRQWSESQQQSPAHSPAAFIAQLPLLPIIPHPSLAKPNPQLSKGQTRLSDLKAGAVEAQKRALKTTTANPQQHPAAAVKKDPFARSASLKSRIFAKQLHNSSLPTPLTPEQLARRSALQRTPEIVPVLESLALGAQRHCNDDADAAGSQPASSRHVSFTMPTLVQNLQMSLRNPVAREEAVRCVWLLAELVPEWVGVREVGRLVGVTVRGTGVGRMEVGRRVETALGRV